MQGDSQDADFATTSKCSTTGGISKNGPTIVRHSVYAGDSRIL
jgi:hypothetical protein